MNRGSYEAHQRAKREADASMRPRFMNRGSTVRSMSPAFIPVASMRPRFMNRGSYNPIGRWTYLTKASMRPRFMNRGSFDQGYYVDHSCGSFNEAPIHESGKSGQNDRSATHCDASMRPRFMNRGSHLAKSVAVLEIAASMRPRFMNRGSGTSYPGDRCQLVALQ